MNLSNENGDIILKVIGVIVGFFSFRWIVKVFAGEDGKLDKHELKKVTAFLFFLWASAFMIIKEAGRPSGTEHIFSEIWIFFVLSGLLTVLSLDKIFDSMSKLIEAMAKLRAPKTSNEEKTN